MSVNSTGHHDRDRAPTDGTGRAGGNKSAVARELNIERRTLYHRIDR
ncbi:MAG: helix-turn-helix domain-containing protein, partial [Acidimicrobiales bacterium]